MAQTRVHVCSNTLGKQQHYVKDARTKKILGQALMYSRQANTQKNAGIPDGEIKAKFGLSDQIFMEFVQSVATLGGVKACGYDVGKVSKYKEFLLNSFQIQLIKSGLKFGTKNYKLLLSSLISSMGQGKIKVARDPSVCGKLLSAFDMTYAAVPPKAFEQEKTKLKVLKAR